jgi:hypothetical protein
MKFFPRISVAFKFMRQFGLRPLALIALYKLGLKTGYYKRESRKQETVPLLSAPLFSLPPRDKLLQILGEEGKAALLKEADQILNGKFRIFGELLPLQLTFDQPLKHWVNYETNPKLLSALCSPASDIKFIWEPARFGWAFILGRAYHATQEHKYAEAFWKYFEIFAQANPPNMGPYWMNGQEVAIRMMALIWAAHVFESAPVTSAERMGELIQSIHAHANRIPPTLIYARSQNNNHLITEAAAIYTAGLFFKDQKWRALGWKWLLWSFRNQIGDFGEYIQHSTNYHRLMLQTALWVNFIKQDVFPASILQALARSAHWLFSLVDNDSGQAPNMGSNDGALIFPFSATVFEDFRPTVQAAARAFLRTNLSSGAWDEMSLWLGLQGTARVNDSSMYLADNLRAKNSWAYLRTSDFKSRLGHMDQLHLDLWWRGLNIAQDAGTYLYNADPPWDNSLMTTRVHNTVMVDGRDQMTRAGRFLVLDWAGGFSKPIIELDEKILHKLKAYFTGYRKFGVKHERMVTVYEDEFWRIEDRLLNSRRRDHAYRLHWLLPDWEWEMENSDRRVQIKLNSPHGPIKLGLSVNHPVSDLSSLLSVVRAGELVHGERDLKPYEGWVSRHYGQKSPALSFAFEVTSPYHTVITSEFTFPK